MADAAGASPQLTFDLIAKLRADIPTGLFVALDHREQMFVLNLLNDPTMHRGRAAIAAGYTVRRAKQTAHELLQKPTVKAALDAAMTVRAHAVAVTAERVLREVDTVGLSDITHYRLSEDGHLEPAEGAPPDCMRAVRSFKRKVRYVRGRDGEGVDKEIESEFTLWDKPTTLRLSMQHRGMLRDREDPVTPDATAAAVRAAMAQMDALTAGAS